MMTTFAAPIADGEMRRLSELIYARSGIALRESKRALIVARLHKRLRLQGFTTFTEYIHFLETDRSGTEVGALLDAITTNHTSFFREPAHFRYLAETVLPALVARSAPRPMTAWSAACATGEELYSMAVTMLEAVPPAQRDRIHLLGTDLSATALRQARSGIYAAGRVADIERPLLHRYFERGLGEQDGLVRVRAEVRRLTEVRRLNLLEIQPSAPIFDVIFCRNVMIYFDRAARQQVVSLVERCLAPNGYLFVSHSEGLTDIEHGLQWCAAGVYRRGAV